MCQNWGPTMSSQEELLEQLAVEAVLIWEQPQLNNGLNQTMIYTQAEAEGLADETVKKACLEATEAIKADVSKEPLSEEEKARLWRAVMESCSG